MATAGLTVEFLFEGPGVERKARDAKVMTTSVTWNYTTVLDILFLLAAAALVWRYFRRGGGWSMLRTINTPMGEHAGHAHHHA